MGKCLQYVSNDKQDKTAEDFLINMRKPNKICPSQIHNKEALGNES